MAEVSSIDDLLSAQSGPRAPEMQPEVLPEPEVSDNDVIQPEKVQKPDYTYDETPEVKEEPVSEPEEPVSEPESKTPEVDDYGNPKAAAKTYTEEEVNERINKAVRERLARINGGQQSPQQQQQQVQQAATDFQFDPNSEKTLPQQLEAFVEQTVSKMTQRETQRIQQQKDAQAEAEFKDKFSQGMDRFSDFMDVVDPQPITPAMTMALRGLNDPAAFLYAASKRNPQELARIAAIADPYVQIREMGRLEERMRKAPAATQAPRPVARTQGDGVAVKKAVKREDTIEDLIAASDAKRRAALAQRRGGR